MKKLIIILAATAQISCGGQSNSKNETFDFAAYEKRMNDDPIRGRFYTKPDGTFVEEIGGSTPVRWETPPKPTFVKVYKEFYSNGNMKRNETYFGKYTRVDISLYYDEKGNMTRKIDENLKFGNIKPNDILRFLEEKQRINIATGEGIFDEEGRETFAAVYIEEKNLWHVEIYKGRPFTASEMHEIMKTSFGEPNDWKSFEYEIDGETGEITVVSD